MNINQTLYRKIDALSASDIKLFAKDRIAFYHQKVLGEKRKDKFSDSLTLGTLIDYCLSDCKGSWQEFHDFIVVRISIFHSALACPCSS